MKSKIKEEKASRPEIKLTSCTRTILTFISQSDNPVDLWEINIFLKIIGSACKTSKRSLKKLCEDRLLVMDVQQKGVKGGVHRQTRNVYSITQKGREAIGENSNEKGS